MEQSIQSNRAGSTEEVIRKRRQRTILRKLRGSDLRKAAFLAIFLVLLTFTISLNFKIFFLQNNAI